MFCTNCGSQMDNNQAVCLQCGFAKGKSKNHCANCGAQVTPGAAICVNCGCSLKASGDRLNGQDKIVMALVCFFLGGIGIHNFMMGETKKGIVKIVLAFCCGISGILALIDFIMILCDKYQADPNKYF